MGKVIWTKEQEEYLENLYSKYLPLDQIVLEFNNMFKTNKQRSAISSKANKIGLTKKYIRPNNPNYKAIYQDYDWYYTHFVDIGLNHEQMAKLAGSVHGVVVHTKK